MSCYESSAYTSFEEHNATSGDKHCLAENKSFKNKLQLMSANYQFNYILACSETYISK